MASRTFRCPKCHEQQTGLALEVAHKCPKNRNKMTPFDLVEEPSGVVPARPAKMRSPKKRGRKT